MKEVKMKYKIKLRNKEMGIFELFAYTHHMMKSIAWMIENDCEVLCVYECVPSIEFPWEIDYVKDHITKATILKLMAKYAK